MWVLDHLVDLESDFSVFHRVDDIYSMPGPRFFQFAMRIGAYQGVLQARITEEQEKRRRKYGDNEVQHKTLTEAREMQGGDSLFETVGVS